MERFKEPDNYLRIDGKVINISMIGDLELAGLWEHCHALKAQVDQQCFTLQQEVQARQRSTQEALDFFGIDSLEVDNG